MLIYVVLFVQTVGSLKNKNIEKEIVMIKNTKDTGGGEGRAKNKIAKD